MENTAAQALGSGGLRPRHQPGAVVNAINDALRPLKAEVWSQPVTPEKILRALRNPQSGLRAQNG